jgi:hypothetical protein
MKLREPLYPEQPLVVEVAEVLGDFLLRASLAAAGGLVGAGLVAVAMAEALQSLAAQGALCVVTQ